MAVKTNIYITLYIYIHIYIHTHTSCLCTHTHISCLYTHTQTHTHRHTHAFDKSLKEAKAWEGWAGCGKKSSRQYGTGAKTEI